MIKALRGMKDIEDPRFLKIFDTAREIAENYGYSYIETPVLEETALFKRSVGESSDIVNKEMYQFTDKGGNDVCLRPEGTAGVVRSFIEHKYDKAQTPKRFWYFGPMFRYERPQKGRLREFHQFGIESFGEPSIYEDINIIAMAADIFDALGIEYTLKINSLGCGECMPKYREKLVEFLNLHKEDLCEDCQRRITQNPIRTLDCKVDSCQAILKDAPKITDNLCENCQKDFETLKKGLENLGIKYEVDKNLVRGLDYYSKTTFEFVSTEIGAQSAIAGGGRYDRLVEYLGGKPTPGVGFAIGIERIMELVKTEKTRKGIYIGVMLEDALEFAQKEAKNLRKNEKVYFEPKVKSLKAHLKAADKGNYKKAMIVGEEELKNKTFFEKEL
ncbi:histidyl-tRNA synthetase [Nautilia profundicola AmH]|uniref:Histidine--tRNA ligase n=1 Tax=Nautilia profundicola (strain ATCC BAA-1463 / DSM 18972 / AmH) TaxID=598659 RepID=B9L830_NAUPA|nr:histidine--tRNA ligase [Nautilia profundicola]ACM92484.1 histidyl-tRNA synthetase [Nautilia profundicola AmH]